MLNKYYGNQKVGPMINGITRIQEEPILGLVNGMVGAFAPGSALVLGSSKSIASNLHSSIKRLMIVDFETLRHEANVKGLEQKAEFYPKVFPVYDDEVVTGKEGLDLSDLFGRIKKFFKDTDLLVTDLPVDLSVSSFNYFKDSTDIFIAKGVDPTSFSYANEFKGYRVIMRYTETSTVLVKNHIPVGFSDFKDTVYNFIASYYKKNNVPPSFRIEEA